MIDLRSDTLTKPTPAMLAAMAAAEVGDEQYLEDPTVNELQRRMAELLGHEAAALPADGDDGEPGRAPRADDARARCSSPRSTRTS